MIHDTAFWLRIIQAFLAAWTLVHMGLVEVRLKPVWPQMEAIRVSPYYRSMAMGGVALFLVSTIEGDIERIFAHSPYTFSSFLFTMGLGCSAVGFTLYAVHLRPRHVDRPTSPDTEE